MDEKLIKDAKGKLVKDPVDRRLGTMPIGLLLFKMSAPMVFSMMLQACYNVVDSIFIARVSEDALSALSLAFPIQFLMIALNIGTNIGMTANISRSLGEKNFDNANDYAKHGLILASFYAIIFALIGIFFSKSFFSLQTSNQNIISSGYDYLSIILIFSFGVFFEISFEKMLQAAGNSIGSMIVQTSGAVFNIIFDPILIFGLFGFPALGAKGAAIATVGGQILGAIIGLIINITNNKSIKLSFKKFKFNKNIVLDIYRIGVPSIIMDSVGSMMILGLNAILIKFPQAVAILGIYYKMESFVFMPLFGLNNGMVPIVSYNFGSKNKKRITEVIKCATISGVIIMLVGTLIFLIIPDKIFMLFAANDRMLKSGVIAFRIIATHFCVAAVNIILSSVMQATKREFYSLVASIIRQIGVLLPCAYIMSLFFDLNHIWLCFPISETVAFIITLILYKKTYKEQIETL